MANTVVKDSHLKFNGVSYFRGHAEEIQIGSYGEKHTSIVTMNFLEVKGHIPEGKIHAAKSTVAVLDTASTSRTDFNTSVIAIVDGVPVSMSGGVAYDKIKSNELKLVKFSVENNAMKTAANDSPGAIKDLIEYGNDARIAHEVFVVLDAKMATSFTSNANVTISVAGGIMQASLGNASSGSTTVQLSPGTTFAYLLVKIKWDATLKKNQTKIVDLDMDQWG